MSPVAIPKKQKAKPLIFFPSSHPTVPSLNLFPQPPTAAGPGSAHACFSMLYIVRARMLACSGTSKHAGGLTKLLEEQRRARLAFRRGLDGTSRLALSPVPMLRVTGRVLVAGLVASGSGRSTGLDESPLRVLEMMGPGLFSA